METTETHSRDKKEAGSRPEIRTQSKRQEQILQTTPTRPLSQLMLPIYPPKPKPSLLEPPTQIAGNLKHHLQDWQKITNDPWVLEAILGYRIQFASPPIQQSPKAPRYDTGRGKGSSTGSGESNNKRGHQGDETSRGLHQQYTRSSKERRGVETNYRSQDLEQLRHSPTFQDGGTPDAERSTCWNKTIGWEKST